jgi:hypothetical protein
MAVERESYTVDSIDSSLFEEEAFGRGPVVTWDTGEVEIKIISPRHFSLVFNGSRIAGKYEFRRMLWYPGNRWLLTKM